MSSGGEPGIELLGRRLVCRNEVYEVYLDLIADRSGRRVPDYLSVVPRGADSSGLAGVAVLPVRRGGDFGLLRIFHHPMGDAGWEIPKGFIDRGESPRAAAVRELAEETGLAAPEDRIVALGSLCPAPGVVRARLALFAAFDVEPAGSPGHEDPGIGSLKFVSPAEMLAMADAGQIDEPCTLVAAYRYLQRR